jgi:single-stranded-DNA-specific exonuclease
VVGILASRVKEKYHRPVIAFADTRNDEIKGSARSISGLHIRDLLDNIATRHPKLLQKFGGHAMAAGLSIAKKDYQVFAQLFDDAVKTRLAASDMSAEIISDGPLYPAEFSITSARAISDSAPWGQAFPEPLFDGTFYLLQQKVVAQKYLKMVLSIDADHRHLVDAIAFSVDISQWPDEQVKKVFIVYHLGVNEYSGNESVQLVADIVEKC